MITACLGQITPNFRLISLHFAKDHWKVRFVLERESDQDLEIAKEIFEDFAAESYNSISTWKTNGVQNFSQSIEQELKMEVTISRQPIELGKGDQSIWLYRRREEQLDG
jgi:hypothetical protein